MIPALERIAKRYNNWANDDEMSSITPKQLKRAILSAYKAGQKASSIEADKEETR